MGIDGEDLHVEAARPLRHTATDRAIADDAHRRPAHLPARPVELSPCPVVISLGLDALRDVSRQGKEQGEGVLADRGTMRAARVGENDVALDQFGQILQVVDPGAGRLDPAQRLGRTQEIGGGEAVEHVRVADLRCQLLRRRDLHDLQSFDLEVIQQREMRCTFRLCQHDFHWRLDSPLPSQLNTASGITRKPRCQYIRGLLLPRGPGATFCERVSHICMTTSQDAWPVH